MLQQGHQIQQQGHQQQQMMQVFHSFFVIQEKTDSIQFVMMTNNDGIPTLFPFFLFSLP